MTGELMILREQYEELIEKRKNELHLPEHRKTLKTPEFVEQERKLLHLCSEIKFRAGIVTEKPGRAYSKVARGIKKFSEADMEAVTHMLRDGFQQAEVARRFGMSKGYVSLLKRRACGN
jgi:DNA-binding CsgD family transcriptional regulator